MIDLGRPALHAEGVTLFPDHADPALFHYLPDRPRLRTDADGVPELSLLEYRLDPNLHAALGAGLLSLTVELGVASETLSRARQRAAASAGGAPVRLAPVAFEAGTCELVLIDRSSTDPAGDAAGPTPTPGFGLVERILGGTSPSLFGTNAAAFSAVLSAEAVALVEQALRQDGLPLGVVYALQTTGLRPALRAEITARWRDVYHFYENRLHGGRLLLATDIGATIEELVRSEALSIRVDELVPADEQSPVYQRALDQAQRYVIEEFFKPTLGQAPPPADDEGGALATIGKTIKDVLGFFTVTYSLRSIDRRELKTFSYQLAVARAERLTLSPQGTIRTLVGPDGPAGWLDHAIVTLAQTASPEMVFDVAPALDLAAEGIEHLEVTLRYGTREQHLLLEPAAPRKTARCFYDAAAGLAVRYSFEAHFTPDGGGDVLKAGERATEGRVIRLDPRELYSRAGLRVVAQGLPFERYPQVIVDLEAREPVSGWSRSETVVLDATHPEASFGARVAAGARLRLRRRARYVDTQGAELVLDWDDVDPGVLVLGDPLPDVVEVQVLGSARFGTEVRRLVVELRPVADPGRVSVRLLSAEQPSAGWSFAAPRGGDRRYEYRVTVHTVRAEVREGPWTPATEAKLIVGEHIYRLRTVELVLVGRTPAELGLVALKARFAFDDPAAALSVEDELLVQDFKQPVRWSYPVADPARQAYSYQLTLVHADGRLDVQPAVTTSDLLVVRALA